jgi:hypothetical protein
LRQGFRALEIDRLLLDLRQRSEAAGMSALCAPDREEKTVQQASHD